MMEQNLLLTLNFISVKQFLSDPQYYLRPTFETRKMKGDQNSHDHLPFQRRQMCAPVRFVKYCRL